jgi:hypothetical protein
MAGTLACQGATRHDVVPLRAPGDGLVPSVIGATNGDDRSKEPSVP